MRTFERRVFPAQDCKIVRASDRTGEVVFRGRPWVYGQMSDDLGGWNEIIEPGAATRTLAANPDVRFLINHDANLLLARTTSGTLRLSEDGDGGLAEATLADVSYARDLATLIERQDMTQMSFGFWVTSDSWSGNLHRVREFDLDGGDVSSVTFPAYPTTSSELRAKVAEILGHQPTDADEAEVRALLQRTIELREGKVLSSANRQLVQDARDALSALLDKTDAADRAGRQPGEQDAAGEAYPLERARDRVAVAEAIASL